MNRNATAVWMQRGRRAVVAAAAMLVPALTAALASPSGRLTGRVTDEHGRPIAGATLTLTGPGTAGMRQITTDADGVYQFQGVPTRESLDMRAAAPGKDPIIFTGLHSRETIAARLDIRLRPPDWKVVLAALDARVPIHQLALEGAQATIAGEVRTLELHGSGRADAAALRAALRDRPNAVLAIGSAPAMLARRATQDLPVVYTMALDPRAEGLETANLCGAPLNGAFGDQLSVLSSLSEGAARVATIYDPRRLDRDVHDLDRAARAHGMSLTALPARTARDARAALRRLEKQSNDAFLMLLDPWLIDQDLFARMKQFTSQSGMVLIVPDASLVAAGGTFSYGPGFRELGAYAGRLVNNILRGAATPAAVGSLFPTTRYLAINPEASRRLGLSIPPQMFPGVTDSGEAGQVNDLPAAAVQAPQHRHLVETQGPR